MRKLRNSGWRRAGRARAFCVKFFRGLWTQGWRRVGALRSFCSVVAFGEYGLSPRCPLAQLRLTGVLRRQKRERRAICGGPVQRGGSGLSGLAGGGAAPVRRGWVFLRFFPWQITGILALGQERQRTWWLRSPERLEETPEPTPARSARSHTRIRSCGRFVATSPESKLVTQSRPAVAVVQVDE